MNSDSHFSSLPQGNFDPAAIIEVTLPEQRLWQAVAIQAMRDCVASDSALGKAEHKIGTAEHARNEARQWVHVARSVLA